jgi:hypothetical protein
MGPTIENTEEKPDNGDPERILRSCSENLNQPVELVLVFLFSSLT